MIAEEPVIPFDGRRVMCDGTHGGVAKEQVQVQLKNIIFKSSLRVILVYGSIWMTAKFTTVCIAVFDIKRRQLMMPLSLLPLMQLLLKHNFNSIFLIYYES